MCQDSAVVLTSSFSTQTTVMLGEQVTMTVTMTLPAGTTTDIELEMLNMENNSAVVSFYGPISTTKIGLTYNVSYSYRDVSAVNGEVYETQYISATVTNNGSSTGTLQLMFGAAVAKALNTTPVLLAIGGTYDDSSIYVWSNQKSFQVSTTQPPIPVYNISINCGPADLEIDYFTLCNATFRTASSYSSVVYINITVSNEKALLANTFSIGSILDVQRVGQHLEIPEDFVRTTSYSYNSDGFSSFATINMGLVVKPAGTGDLVVQFSLSSHNDDAYANQTVIVNASIIVSGALAGSGVQPVTTVPSKTTAIALSKDMLTIKVVGDNETTVSTISSGSLFQYEVTVNTSLLASKYRMYLATAPSVPDLTVCDMKLYSRDFNTPFVFPPTAYFDHVFGYNIHNTRQVADFNSGFIKYRVVGQYFGQVKDSAKINFALENGTPASSTGMVVIGAPMNPTKVFKSARIERSAGTLVPNRAVGMKLTIELYQNATYPDIELLMIPDKKNQSHIPLRVCASLLGDVTVPCVKVRESLVRNGTSYFRNQNDSIYMNDFSDSISVNLGTLSTLDTSGKVEFLFLVSMPWGDPQTEMIPVSLNATGIEYKIGATVGDYFAWIDNVKLNISVANMISSPYNMTGGLIENPRLFLKPANKSAIAMMNAPFQLLVEIKVGPGMTQDIDLVVYPPNGTELCRLSLMEAGRYLGCTPGGDWYQGERFIWRNTTRLRYGSTPPSARLTLFGLTNVGNQSINVTDNTHNSLLVNIPLFILPGFAGGEVKAQLYLAKSSLLPLAESVYAIVPTTGSTALVPASTNLTFSVTPSTYAVRRPNVLEVEVHVPKGAAHEMILSLTAPADTPICASHVLFVGELMPCVNGSKATHTISSDGRSAEVNLGRVCRIEQRVVDFPDTDVIRVLAAFLPAPSASGSRQFTADVKYNGVKQNINVNSAAVYPGSGGVNGTEVVTVIRAEFDANETRIKENATAFFTISIPQGAAIPVKVKLSAFPSESRPSLTLSNLTLTSVGRNMLCAGPLIREVLTTVSYNSSLGDPVELDTVEVDFGVLANTGFTKLTNNDMPEDNYLTLSIDATLTDAPWNDNDAYVGVLLQVTSGANKNITQGSATMQVLHEDTDLPVMNLSLTVEYPAKIYTRMDEVRLIFSIGHLEASMAEPFEVELLMYLPYGNYLNFTRYDAVGIQPRQVYFPPDITRLITKFGPVRFFDTSVVSYYFKVNPDNNRHFGLRTYNLTIPYIITIKLAQRFNIEGYERFPDNDTGRLPPVISHIRVTIDTPMCSDDILLSNSAIFPDCLFTASSVLNSSFPPHFARVTSMTPWVPRYSGSREYLEVDLVNLHVIAKILSKSPVDFLRVKELIIAASVDGSDWEDYVNMTLPDVTGLTEVVFTKSLTGRYFRIYIVSSYGSGRPVGLLFDFRGCPLSIVKNSSAVCANVTLPVTSDADTKGRHLAVDSTLDVGAFCENSIKLNGNKCYISRDAGIVWNALPYYIEILHGYNPITHKLYASNYQRNVYYFSTDGGIHWTPVLEGEKNASEISTPWEASKAIPYKPVGTQQSLGNWAADSTGILHGSVRVASWGSCCYHTLQ
ncbi:uncharacterized protein [Macrobrachium rosenbergii]|uniref:uncharacterized protein n=1 Tax=Macrobrachium rosenbergii TaxID=79674 RepID=UPI0034D564AC